MILQVVRFNALAQVFTNMGFYRKASFFKRMAAKSCVAHANPNPNWLKCYYLMLESLPGFSLPLDVEEYPSGEPKDLGQGSANCTAQALYLSSEGPAVLEGHIPHTFGEYALPIKTCEYWFRHFKSGYFDTSDKEREGRPVMFEDTELESLLDQNSCLTQAELAETLGVTQQAISNHLKAMGMIQK
ncbi:mariner Mos1 transposase [Trichonephila clavipes]|nr:mariner Mos1 transposase [Trichonephila clavipes]